MLGLAGFSMKKLSLSWFGAKLTVNQTGLEKGGLDKAFGITVKSVGRYRYVRF